MEKGLFKESVYMDIINLLTYHLKIKIL